MNEEKSVERLKNACAVLSEHFDSVQIFATLHKGNEGTWQATVGAGNYFARRDQVRYWLKQEDMSDGNL